MPSIKFISDLQPTAIMKRNIIKILFFIFSSRKITSSLNNLPILLPCQKYINDKGKTSVTLSDVPLYLLNGGQNYEVNVVSENFCEVIEKKVDHEETGPLSTSIDPTKLEIFLQNTKELDQGLIGTPTIIFHNEEFLGAGLQNLPVSFVKNAALRIFPENFCGSIGYLSGKYSVVNINQLNSPPLHSFRLDKKDCAVLFMKILNEQLISPAIAQKIVNKKCIQKNKNQSKIAVLECSGIVSFKGTLQKPI